MESTVHCFVCGSPVLNFYTKIEDETIKDILLYCANGHKRSLTAYIKKDAISKKYAGILAGQAQEGVELIREARNRPFRESDFIPNPKVEELGWQCVRCNNPAKWAPGDPLKKEHALCFPCRAAFMAWDWRKDIFAPHRTHGRPGNLFWSIQFQRFLNNTDPIVGEAKERLLEDCRSQAQRHNKKSDTEFIKKTADDLRYTS